MNPARVIPAAKGCYKRVSSLMIPTNEGMTYSGNAHFVFVAYMDVLDGDLEVVDDLCGQRSPQALRLLRVILMISVNERSKFGGKYRLLTSS